MILSPKNKRKTNSLENKKKLSNHLSINDLTALLFVTRVGFKPTTFRTGI